MDAPSSPWLVRPAVSGKKIVSSDWGTLLLETATNSMGGYSVTDLVC
jgi:hypothetical protein